MVTHAVISRAPAEIREALQKSGAQLVAKSEDPLMTLLGLFIGPDFMSNFWTTYRLPFEQARICYPSRATNPSADLHIIDHELVHVAQFAPWWGPLWMMLLAVLVPLPFFFSGRWFIERHAYLRDILAGRRTVQNAVLTLWDGYGAPWPKKLMRQWFEREVARVRS